MVAKLSSMGRQIGNALELAIALIRITLGMVALILGLIIVDIMVYISLTGSSYDEKIMKAYDAGYANSYTQAYDDAYQQAYLEAYPKGYGKEYAMGLKTDSEEPVANRVPMRNPTYRELKEFLASDKTDTNLYIPYEYVSFDFAVELNNSAEGGGIRAAVVTVVFPKKSHGIVAFETTDEGLVFIEPQSDAEVDVVQGKSYWRSANGMTSTYYDDTIVDIQILW